MGTISGNNGHNTIEGTNGPDLIRGFAGFDLLIGGVGDDTLDGGNGNDTLVGGVFADLLIGGIGSDSFDGGGGNDTYVVSTNNFAISAGTGVDLLRLEGTRAISNLTLDSAIWNLEIRGSLSGTGGADVFDLSPVRFYLGAERTIRLGAGNDRFTGSSVGDFVYGDAGNDTLLGGDGNDSLAGGTGADCVNGGAGDDTIVIDQTTDLGRTNWNGGAGIDFLQINGTVEVSSFTLKAASSIEYLSITGQLRGTAGHNLFDLSETAVTSWSTPIALGIGQDTYKGSQSRDRALGEAGNDTLFGNDGDDSLDGGAGFDRMIGGEGDDSYVVDTQRDVIVEGTAAGQDKIFTALSYSLGANVEDLTLTGIGNTSGTGNSVSNWLTGNGGNNRLDGQGGDDWLQGGDGNDWLTGGAGSDYFDGGSGNDTIHFTTGTGVERSIYGGTGNDIILVDGDVAMSRLALYSYNSIEILDVRGELSGTAGNDQFDLSGLGGYAIRGKLISLRNGNDSFIGSAAGDAVDGSVGNDTLQTGLGQDTLQGGGGHDSLIGGDGVDRMAGGTGNDTYVVDHALDYLVETSNGGTDLVLSAVSFTLSDYVDNLTLTGSGNLNGTGSAQANTIVGNSYGNMLKGEGGADMLIGGWGADTLTGGSGADTFTYLSRYETGISTDGADQITDFGNTDRIDLAAIDADTRTFGDQMFSFVGRGPLVHAGDLRFADGILEGDINGDGMADFTILLTGVAVMTSDDFVL